MEHFTKVTESVLYDLLSSHWGYDDFRYPQKEVILDLLDKKNVLGIMPTGSGKSLCYQMLSLVTENLILVVTPLIALMDDQVEQANSVGVLSACFHSSLTIDEQKSVTKTMHSGKLRLLFISPERLQVNSFLTLLKDIKISVLVVDEAHCISQWGYDFRPSYLGIGQFIKSQEDMSVLALSATAPYHIQKDIRKQLGIKNSSVYKTSLYRENLKISIQYSTQKLDVLKTAFIGGASSIVYLRHRKHVELVSQKLNQSGVLALPYHAGLDSSVRQQNQTLWMENKVVCMVSTNAFGMGINKPDVRYVFHYKPPSSIEDYIQEIGRAGRDGEISECVMLYNHKDIHELSRQYSKLKGIFGPKYQRSKKNSRRKMLGYLKREMCRFRYVLDYFDEYLTDDCGKCDVCLSKQSREEMSGDFQPKYFSGEIQLQKFMSQYDINDREEILKELNILINSGKMKLKDVYLAWNKPNWK